MPPAFYLTEGMYVKTQSQNSTCMVLTNSSGQSGLKFRIYISLLSFSASGSRLQHVVKTGSNKALSIANIGAELKSISLLSVKTSHQFEKLYQYFKPRPVAFSKRERGIWRLNWQIWSQKLECIRSDMRYTFLLLSPDIPSQGALTCQQRNAWNCSHKMRAIMKHRNLDLTVLTL